jgi:hypothetical protein
MDFDVLTLMTSLLAVAYTNIVGQLISRDPNGAVLAFADMMKKGIVMPAHFMDDEWHSQKGANPGQNLFTDYATVADSLGVYTTGDYADIVHHLVCESFEFKVPHFGMSERDLLDYCCSFFLGSALGCSKPPAS